MACQDRNRFFLFVSGKIAQGEKKLMKRGKQPWDAVVVRNCCVRRVDDERGRQ